jgi:hypothetical protein
MNCVTGGRRTMERQKAGERKRRAPGKDIGDFRSAQMHSILNPQSSEKGPVDRLHQLQFSSNLLLHRPIFLKKRASTQNMIDNQSKLRKKRSSIETKMASVTEKHAFGGCSLKIGVEVIVALIRNKREIN